jgi:putative phage-type endonuclease
VYAAKVNPARSEELTPPLEWGHRLEPVVSGAIMDHHGWKLEKVPTIRHRRHEWLIASPDRVNQDNELIEIKTTSRSEGWGEPETAEIPEQYWLQCQHQLEVADRETCWVFVLIGHCDFRRYRVERDPEYMPTVFDLLSDFWKCVESKTPPEPDWGHPATLAAVKRMFVPKAGTAIDLSENERIWADEYQRCGEEIKALESMKDELKARLIVSIGEHEVGNLPDGRSISRKMVKRKAYEVKAVEYPDFRILKAKGDK